MPDVSTAARNDWIIRPALDVERRACRMLLPSLRKCPEHGLFVALQGRAQRIVAAGGLCTGSVPKPNAPWTVDVHVVPSARRQGIARAILKATEAAAKNHHAGRLELQPWIPADLDHEAAFTRLGFHRLSTRREFAVTMDDLVNGLGALYRGVVRRRQNTGEAALVNAARVSPEAIAALYAKVFGCAADDIRLALSPAGPDSIDLGLSNVIMVGGEVVAMVLGRSHHAQRYYDCDWVAVDPKYRRKGFNLWLLHDTAIQCRAAGLLIARYRALEAGGEDTIHIMKHFNGRQTGASIRMAMNLRQRV